jgi:hypothetical protein
MSLNDEQANSRQLGQRLEALHEAEQHARVSEAQLAERSVLAERLTEQLSTATAQAERFSQQVRELELSLAATQAKMEVQQALNDELRSYLKQQNRTEKAEGK